MENKTKNTFSFLQQILNKSTWLDGIFIASCGIVLSTLCKTWLHDMFMCSWRPDNCSLQLNGLGNASVWNRMKPFLTHWHSQLSQNSLRSIPIYLDVLARLNKYFYFIANSDQHQIVSLCEHTLFFIGKGMPSIDTDRALCKSLVNVAAVIWNSMQHRL